MLRRSVGWIAALLALAACAASAEPLPQVSVRIEQGKSVLDLRVEVAATAEAQERGLMGRTGLAPGAGMLFLFGSPQQLQFWMKDTLIPLDIAFIRGDRVVDVHQMRPCRRDPCPLTTARALADSALEVPLGTFAKAGIGAGARVVYQGKLPPVE
jgi:hypothetical protein